MPSTLGGLGGDRLGRLLALEDPRAHPFCDPGLHRGDRPDDRGHRDGDLYMYKKYGISDQEDLSGMFRRSAFQIKSVEEEGPVHPRPEVLLRQHLPERLRPDEQFPGLAEPSVPCGPYDPRRRLST